MTDKHRFNSTEEAIEFFAQRAENQIARLQDEAIAHRLLFDLLISMLESDHGFDRSTVITSIRHHGEVGGPEQKRLAEIMEKIVCPDDALPARLTVIDGGGPARH